MVNEALARTHGPMVFIVGSGRSGTSLLAAMLDAHPDLSIAPESHFLPKLIEGLPPRLTSGDHIDRMLEVIRTSKWFVQWEGYDLDALGEALRAELPIDRADALRMIYRVHAAAAQAARYGEKTPAYVYNIPLIAGEMSDARFIHIIRDGRNVALSFRDASFGSDDIAHSMLNWQLRVLDGHRKGTTLGPDRYIEVGYEALVGTPEAELRRLCAFLDLEYAPAMLEYYLRRDSIWSPRHEESEHLAEPPRTTRDWRDQLSAHEQARLELLGRKALHLFGYDLAAQPSIGDRLGAFWDELRWYLYRFRSKTGMAQKARATQGRRGGQGASG